MINPQLNPMEFPFEEHIKLPNANGELVPLVRQTKKKEINNYWNTQKAKVGLLLGFSSLVLVSVLLNESNVLSGVWSFLLGTIGGLVGFK